MQERFELHGHDHVHQRDGDEQRREQAGELFLHVLGAPGGLEGDARTFGNVLFAELLNVDHGFAHGVIAGDVGGDGQRGLAPVAFDDAGGHDFGDGDQAGGLNDLAGAVLERNDLQVLEAGTLAAAGHEADVVAVAAFLEHAGLDAAEVGLDLRGQRAHVDVHGVGHVAVDGNVELGFVEAHVGLDVAQFAHGLHLGRKFLGERCQSFRGGAGHDHFHVLAAERGEVHGHVAEAGHGVAHIVHDDVLGLA